MGEWSEVNDLGQHLLHRELDEAFEEVRFLRSLSFPRRAFWLLRNRCGGEGHVPSLQQLATIPVVCNICNFDDIEQLLLPSSLHQWVKMLGHDMVCDWTANVVERLRFLIENRIHFLLEFCHHFYS